jgi:hypothetical protein
LREFESGVVEAARHLLAHDGRAAAANGRVRPGDPHAVYLNAALNSADTERNLVLGLLVDLGYWLRLKHFRRLGLLALVDLCVLAELVLLVYKFEKSSANGDNLSMLAMHQRGVVG